VTGGRIFIEAFHPSYLAQQLATLAEGHQQPGFEGMPQAGDLLRLGRSQPPERLVDPRSEPPVAGCGLLLGVEGGELCIEAVDRVVLVFLGKARFAVKEGGRRVPAARERFAPL